MSGTAKWGPTLIRLVLGLVFLWHGWGKVQGFIGWIQGYEWGFVGLVASINFLVILSPVIWALMATLAEFVGGILILLGYKTRVAALAITAVMVVAIAGVHLPAGDNIEKQLALLTMAVSLILTGPGRYSIKIKR